MAHLIFSDGSWSVLSLKTGESFGIRYMVEKDDNKDLADVDYKDVSRGNHRGFHKVTAKQDIILLVEDLYGNGKTAKHCRFIRADRKDAVNLELRQVRRFPRAQRRLRKAGMPHLTFIGGFNLVPAYDDEAVIADYWESGTHGWVVERGPHGPSRLITPRRLYLLSNYPAANLVAGFFLFL